MIHYIYKILFLKGTPEGRYYIGKRSTDKYDNWKEDPYTGSGTFCYNYFEKYGKVLGETYEKQCLEETDSFEENLKREAYWIGDLYKLDPLCMNLQPGGCGPTEYDHKAHPSYKIDQYTKDCVFVKTWDSIKEAAESTGSNESAIGACIRGRNPNRHLCNGYIWVKHGEPPINNKTNSCEGPVKVNQYDDEGNLLATYDSYRDAAEAVDGNWQGVQRVCNGMRVKHRGYIWAKEGQEPRFEGIGRKKHKIGQYDKNGNFVKSYNTAVDAAKEVGCSPHAITECCLGNGKLRKTSNGYVWKYID